MRNICQKIKVLEDDSTQSMVKIKFLESDTIMPISRDLLIRKVKDDLYRVTK